MRILELCAGYGGLGIAVEQLTGGRVQFVAETDPHASVVLAARFPTAPNLGDVRSIDWTLLRGRVDAITAGFPCQNISHAGRREGIDGDRSRIWSDVVNAVRVLRPHYLYLENVSALRTRGLDRVAGDLAAIGYDMRWTCLRAGAPSVGACHARDRWFALAYPTASNSDHVRRNRRPRRRGPAAGWAEPPNSGDTSTPDRLTLLPTPKASDGPKGSPNQRDSQGFYYLPGQAVRLDHQWRSSDGTDYAPAIRRWEKILGYAAPPPTEITRFGNYRLSPAFVEWMMGLEPAWVSGLGLPRGQAIRILGNGAVPHQAYRAYQVLTAQADEPASHRVPG